MDDDSFHVTPEEFRRRGRDLVDWIADYRERVEDLPDTTIPFEFTYPRSP